MNPNPLIQWSLRELSTALRSGELTPTQLTGIALESARRSAVSRAFLAIDEAVIVAEGEIHHRADFHFAIERYGSLLDGVHAEDAALRWIEDRGAEQ